MMKTKDFVSCFVLFWVCVVGGAQAGTSLHSAGAASVSQSDERKSCPCGRAQAVRIDSAREQWIPIMTVQGNARFELDATGEAWFGKRKYSWVRNIAIDAGKAAIGAAITAYCPQCSVGIGIVNMGLDQLKDPGGMEKFHTAFGVDPRVNPKPGERNGSKKCGGLLVAFGPVNGQHSQCPCRANLNVYHLVKDGLKRFGGYAHEHRYITREEFKKKSFGPGTIYAMAWDRPGKYGDNLGQFGVKIVGIKNDNRSNAGHHRVPPVSIDPAPEVPAVNSTGQARNLETLGTSRPEAEVRDGKKGKRGEKKKGKGKRVKKKKKQNKQKDSARKGKHQRDKKGKGIKRGKNKKVEKGKNSKPKPKGKKKRKKRAFGRP